MLWFKYNWNEPVFLNKEFTRSFILKLVKLQNLPRLKILTFAVVLTHSLQFMLTADRTVQIFEESGH